MYSPSGAASTARAVDFRVAPGVESKGEARRAVTPVSELVEGRRFEAERLVEPVEVRDLLAGDLPGVREALLADLVFFPEEVAIALSPAEAADARDPGVAGDLGRVLVALKGEAAAWFAMARRPSIAGDLAGVDALAGVGALGVDTLGVAGLGGGTSPALSPSFLPLLRVGMPTPPMLNLELTGGEGSAAGVS